MSEGGTGRVLGFMNGENDTSAVMNAMASTFETGAENGDRVSGSQPLIFAFAVAMRLANVDGAGVGGRGARHCSLRAERVGMMEIFAGTMSFEIQHKGCSNKIIDMAEQIGYLVDWLALCHEPPALYSPTMSIDLEDMDLCRDGFPSILTLFLDTGILTTRICLIHMHVPGT
ncbi:hypothetical protein CC78DRAFT_577212 [Lojkania enalia]|uniref:Uncharacterized protein n=1 Tax=Lojkania enalia TaxID=147567 RepID=A0A9P4KG30_9PLEO|nr:hypothetical protein CC78DRAFT_577212 [Didymosphaeria enalia]